MGTRADFYVGKGENAEWLGSISWDGYPSGIDTAVLQANTESEYRFALQQFFASRDDATLPERGWPWPWNDSNTSDYAYTFALWDEGLETGRVWCSTGYPGRYWWNAREQEPSEEDDNYREILAGLERCKFPDMSARKRVRYDKGSGLIIGRST